MENPQLSLESKRIYQSSRVNGLIRPFLPKVARKSWKTIRVICLWQYLCPSLPDHGIIVPREEKSLCNVSFLESDPQLPCGPLPSHPGLDTTRHQIKTHCYFVNGIQYLRQGCCWAAEWVAHHQQSPLCPIGHLEPQHCSAGHLQSLWEASRHPGL